MFQRYCEDAGIPVDDPAHVIPAWAAGNWLEEIARDGRLASSTIATYRAAASTWCRERGMAGESPFDDFGVARVMKGIERRPRTRGARGVSRESFAVTTGVLAEIAPVAQSQCGDVTKHACWAAAQLGVYGVLRPSEILGSKVHPQRGLKVGQIKAGHATSGAPTLEFHIGASKTDQLGVAPEGARVISAKDAREAIEAWTKRRAGLSSRTDHLFVDGQGAPLTSATLTSQVARWIAESRSGESPHVTGKSFRRGGANTLAAAGAPLQDVQAAGGWRSLQALEHYVTANTRRERAIAIGASMAPTSRGSYPAAAAGRGRRPSLG